MNRCGRGVCAQMQRLAIWFGGALLSALAPTVAQAHAIHTTLTVATVAPAGLTLQIRTFADDFSAAVARFAGKRAPADSSAPDADVTRYVLAHVELRDGRNQRVVLQPCGFRRAAELYWLCFRAPAATGSGYRFLNTMLSEFHADQVNIVQLDNRGARRTLLFTRGSPLATLTLFDAPQRSAECIRERRSARGSRGTRDRRRFPAIDRYSARG